MDSITLKINRTTGAITLPNNAAGGRISSTRGDIALLALSFVGINNLGQEVAVDLSAATTLRCSVASGRRPEDQRWFLTSDYNVTGDAAMEDLAAGKVTFLVDLTGAELLQALTEAPASKDSLSGWLEVSQTTTIGERTIPTTMLQMPLTIAGDVDNNQSVSYTAIEPYCTVKELMQQLANFTVPVVTNYSEGAIEFVSYQTGAVDPNPQTFMADMSASTWILGVTDFWFQIEALDNGNNVATIWTIPSPDLNWEYKGLGAHPNKIATYLYTPTTADQTWDRPDALIPFFTPYTPVFNIGLFHPQNPGDFCCLHFIAPQLTTVDYLTTRQVQGAVIDARKAGVKTVNPFNLNLDSLSIGANPVRMVPVDTGAGYRVDLYDAAEGGDPNILLGSINVDGSITSMGVVVCEGSVPDMSGINAATEFEQLWWDVADIIERDEASLIAQLNAKVVEAEAAVAPTPYVLAEMAGGNTISYLNGTMQIGNVTAPSVLGFADFPPDKATAIVLHLALDAGGTVAFVDVEMKGQSDLTAGQNNRLLVERLPDTIVGGIINNWKTVVTNIGVL